MGNPGVGGAGDQNALIDGIDYLNQKWADAVWVVEPNSCKRVSCSWNSAIWLCSDAKSTLQAATKDITALATLIIDNCIENTLMAIWTHGKFEEVISTWIGTNDIIQDAPTTTRTGTSFLEKTNAKLDDQRVNQVTRNPLHESAASKLVGIRILAR